MEENLIPVEVIQDIGEIYSYYGVSTYLKGDIFMYDPNNSMHIELEDSGFFKHIDNDKCLFYSTYPDLDLGDKVYQIDELLDVKHLTDEAIDCLCLVGKIRKVVESKDKKDLKENNKKSKSFKYSDIAKSLNISFKEFREKTKDLEIKIGKACDKVGPTKMKKILGALK